MKYFIGVDVGTASVRAAVMAKDGKILSCSVEPIQIFNPKPYFYEQSSDEIWDATCKTVQRAIKDSNVLAADIMGIGFDATCSLVALSHDGSPISISSNGSSDTSGRCCNIIMWMDHRAHDQASRINALDHLALKYVGGKISVEMQIPKLLWIYENLPDVWTNISTVLDLPDFLVLKAIGKNGSQSNFRSSCSSICKWCYIPGIGWPHELFQQIGLYDLSKRIDMVGGDALELIMPGNPCGKLSAQASKSLGLTTETIVSSSLIDAYAGVLGTIGSTKCSIDKTLSIIAGTSSCHMALSFVEVFVSGVWGPYKSVLLQDFHVLEGGQSVAGRLVEFIVENHPKYYEMKNQSLNIYEHLNDAVYSEATSQNLIDPALLSRNYHMTCDFHGNRSPIADPNIKASCFGESLNTDMSDLVVKYCSTLLSLAYGTRHIIETLKQEGGIEIQEIVMSGGLVQNDLFVKFHADVTGLDVIIPKTVNYSVVKGAAILGYSAYLSSISKSNDEGGGSCLKLALNETRDEHARIKPRKEMKKFHDKKYLIYRKMQQIYYDFENIMMKDEQEME